MSKGGQLTHDLYRWLVQLQVLPNNQKYKSSGNFQLEPRITQQMISGYIIAKLLSAIAVEKGANINQPLMTSIKNSNTPAAKVYNWNILNDGFTKIGITLSKERQKQITSGNFESLVRFLLDVYTKIVPKKNQKQKLSAGNSTNQAALDIKKMRKYQQISDCETVLEFILVLLTKNLGLTSKQAVATLSESAKYLAHMFVKGIKGSFDEIQNFILELTQRMPQIMYLVEKDAQKNIEFLLQILKPTLISRDSDIAKAGSSALKAFNYQSLKYNSKNIVYQILARENEGFDFIYMGLKRHPELNFQIFDFLYPLIQHALFDFIEVQLPRTINSQQEYLTTLLILMQPLLKSQQAKKTFYSQTKLFTTWQKNYDLMLGSKGKGKQSGALNEESKMLRTELMCMVWIAFYKDMQGNQSEDLLMKITQELKRNTRSANYIIKIPSLHRIFDLLDYLATNKNKLAALLYKKIIFLFVQHHHETETRQVILENLIIILQKFPTIPLEFLLEPLLKQLNSKEGTSYILNMYDFEFVVEVCKHPKMEEYYAISFLEYFTRLYIKSVVYSSLSFRIIQVITARFCESEQIREYCLHSAESNLNHYSMLVMGKNMGNKAMHNRDRAQTKEELIINNQKKSLIIELVKHYVQLEHRELTDEIRQMVVQLFVLWYENKNYYDKGLASVLMLIGDIQEIVLNYKQKMFKKMEQQGQQLGKVSERGSEPGESSPSKLSQHKSLLKYNFDSQFDERETPINKIGVGYKKNNKMTPLNKYELMLSKKVVKPDPKVLQDLEKIKQKWKLEQSRSKVQERERIQKQGKIPKINSTQLLQRNLSLGYVKLPSTVTENKILFDFGSVKTKYLKDTLDLIQLDEQEQRQRKSVDNVISRYSKYLKNLFNKYASKSLPMGKQTDQKSFVFTEIMRMLKQKDLLAKIPKIAINQMISHINKKKKQKNLLSGIEQEDFPTFIIYLTDLLMQQSSENKKDQPFGNKVEKVILKMVEDEKNVRQLFDPKILKLKEQVEYKEDIEIPDEYKKVKEVQVVLDYYVNEQQFSVDKSILTCYQIVDQILYEALAIHAITPMTQLVQKTTLARKYKVPNAKIYYSQSTEKKVSRVGTENDVNNSEKINHKEHVQPRKKGTKNFIRTNKSKTHRNLLIEDSMKADQLAQKQKRRQQHAKKLKQQIQRLRQQKLKHQAQKRQQQKKQEERKKKKEEMKQHYLEQNKRKIKQARQKQEREAKQNEKKQAENKAKKKAEIKAKQVQLLEKQKKVIEKKHEILQQKKRKQEFKEKQKQKLSKSKSDQKVFAEIKNSAAQQKMKDLMIKNSIENGELKVIKDKYEKQFVQLFQSYWIWDKQKMDLKGLSQFLRDFDVCNEYVSPKLMADTFKNVTKGQFLNLSGFEECLAKLAIKSSVIEEKCKQNLEKAENKQQDNNKLFAEQFNFLIKLLKMNQPGYKQIISKNKTKT